MLYYQSNAFAFCVLVVVHFASSCSHSKSTSVTVRRWLHSEYFCVG